MQIPRKLFNTKGQMLVEVVGAVVVTAAILTSAAAALMGNWQAVARMSKTVPDVLRMESQMNNLQLTGCGSAKQPAMGCAKTANPDILQFTIKSLAYEQKTLPILVYAP